MVLEAEIKALRDSGYIEGELSVHPLWYILWEPENIAAYNKEYEVAEYAPGFTAFGSSGGNELLVVNKTGEIFTIPAICMEAQYAEKVASNFEALRPLMQRNK